MYVPNNKHSNTLSNYRSPNSTVIGGEGHMYGEAMKTDRSINYQDFGIFANDNTYAVTFNPFFNQPKTEVHVNPPVRPPPTNQRVTKTFNEPPADITDNGMYVKNPTATMPTPRQSVTSTNDSPSIIQGTGKQSFFNTNVIY